jgi:hypothetical protein
VTSYPATSPVYGWPLLQGSVINDWRQVDDAFLAIEDTVNTVVTGSLGITQADADLRYLRLIGGGLSGGLAIAGTLSTTGATTSGGPLTVQGKAVAVSASTPNLVVWNTDGFFVSAAAMGDVTVTTDASLTSVESPANTFALAAVVSPDAGNGLSLHGNGLFAASGATGTTFWSSFVIDGGGSAITTGQKGHFVVPAGTIVEVQLLADQTGSIVVDLWKDTYANYPPVAGDSICASAKPTLSSAAKSQDTTLTGWTTTVAEGDVIAVNVDSAATVQRVTLGLRLQRS